MDYIPDNRASRLQWWKGIRDNISEEGPKFGLPADQITAAMPIAVAMITIMEATEAAESALKGARSAEKTARTANESAIRAKVRNWKTLPGYAASGSEGVLKLRGEEENFDPNAHKPVLKVSIVGGKIVVGFKKNGADGVAVYSRLRGNQGWTRLGIDMTTPYYDTRPLAQPGVAETREYMARGIVDDEEIGVDSDIVSIVFGG